MKYVVFGYIGFDNFGDELITLVTTEKLKQNRTDKITIISSNPQKTSEMYKVNTCGMFKFLPAIFECDTLISGGGSLLQDVTSLKSLIYYIGIILIALILGKKIELHAQGIGPINSKSGQILAKFVLKKVAKISVRDVNSQTLLKKWGITSELVNDPALDLVLPQKQNVGTIGIQLRQFKSVNEKFLDWLAEDVINKYSDKKIELISLQDSIDLEVCEKFAHILNQKGINNVQIKSKLSVQDVINVISNLEVLIAMRFHASVIGIKSGIKTIAINYDPKVKALADKFNIPIIELF